MAVAVKKTPAEQALVEQFGAIEPVLPGRQWMAQERRAALEAFQATGLPHRRMEEWKYTDLRSQLKEAFPPAPPRDHGMTSADVDMALGAFAAIDAYRIVLVDGWHAAELSPLDGLGVEAAPIKATTLGQSYFGASLARSAAAQANPLTPLIDAYFSDGAVIRYPDADHRLVAPDAPVRVSKPLLIVHLATARAPERSVTRSVLDIGAGLSITVIEVHCRIGEAPVQALAATTVWAGPNTTIDHVKVLRAGAGLAQHLGHTDVVLDQGATYRGFQMTCGPTLARHDVTVTFNQPNAKIDLAGLMLGRGADHIDTTLVVEHRDTGSISRELYKAVLEDTARAVFQGKVIVQPEAQKTDGKMMAQALMLSPTAEFDSKPELEIYADDVVCGHGSTVAELDPDHLFYLRARGITAAEARALLIHAFIREPIDKVVDEGVRSALQAEAAVWLGSRAVTDDWGALEE